MKIEVEIDILDERRRMGLKVAGENSQTLLFRSSDDRPLTRTRSLILRPQRRRRQRQPDRCALCVFLSRRRSTMAEASWQEILRQRLVERNTKEALYAPIIDQCTPQSPFFLPLLFSFFNAIIINLFHH